MTTVVADLETNGLLPELDRIHSLVFKDLDTGEMVSAANTGPGQSWDGPGIKAGLARLREADRIYFHNGLDFDIPAIKKVFPRWDTDAQILDTMVLARARFAHIEDEDYKRNAAGDFPGRLIRSHSLEAWGRRLGVYKGDYEGGWEHWSPAMQEYCEQDVVVTQALVEHLAECGLPSRAVKMEHNLKRYLTRQEKNGWPFDVSAAAQLQAKLSGRRSEIEQELIDEVGWWYESKGQTNPKQSRTMRKNFDPPQRYYEGAPYTLLKKTTFNPGSRKHIAKVLQDRGWEPEVFTPKSGDPKISEEILKGIDLPIADKLVEYLTLEKRLGQIAEGRQAWLKQAEENEHTGENHIHHRCYQKPRTHRQAHSSPNLAQVPSNDSPYGEECRELFKAPEGWIMLGSDVSGLELRTLAHYLYPADNGAYAEEVLSGDVHSRNAEILGCSRPEAKVFIYALIYGAGNETLGRGLVPAEASDAKAKRVGKEKRETFMEELPALERLQTAVEGKYYDDGYLRLIDGRRAYPNASYAALNTLIQGTGGLICKAWVNEMARRFTERWGNPGPYWEPVWKWPEEAMWAGLGFVHDEVQLAMKTPEIAEEAGQIAREAVKAVGQEFDYRLPLDADYDIGPTWAQTH